MVRGKILQADCNCGIFDDAEADDVDFKSLMSKFWKLAING